MPGVIKGEANFSIGKNFQFKKLIRMGIQKDHNMTLKRFFLIIGQFRFKENKVLKGQSMPSIKNLRYLKFEQNF